MTITQSYEVDIADVEYLQHGDTAFLARVFRPLGTGPFPIMVELHGGAWVNGTRLDGNAANEALAKNGVIVVALDFRVPPVASYPASLADIHYGIRWCKTQAADWNGSPDKVGVMGTSTGGHQSMLLGLRPDDPRYAALSLPAGSNEVDGTVACAILVSPLTDPLGRYQYAKGLREGLTPPDGMADRVPAFHDQYWLTEEAMIEGAPARILGRGERTSLPPMLSLAREYEASHPRPDLDEFIMQYRRAGGEIDVTFFGEAYAGDGLLKDLSLPIADETLEVMTAFIYKHLS
jgi:acetyl esterase